MTCGIRPERACARVKIHRAYEMIGPGGHEQPRVSVQTHYSITDARHLWRLKRSRHLWRWTKSFTTEPFMASKLLQQRRASAFMHDTNVQYANAQAAFMHSSIVRETQRLSLVHRHERTQAGNTCDQI